jgi:hypothetical protein
MKIGLQVVKAVEVSLMVISMGMERKKCFVNN